MNWIRSGTLNAADLRKRYPFATLVRKHVGLIEKVIFPAQRISVPVFEVASSSLGNLSMTFPHVRNRDGADMRNGSLGGAGSDIASEIAWVRSVVESAERYATTAFDENEFTVARGVELGASALDLNLIPCCSERELANPQCPLRAPSMEEPIRWLRGYSLVNKTLRFVPAVMTHLYIAPWRTERFWLPISTGVAAHVNPVAALVAAICEVIERDAIASTWLARLPLPRIDLSNPPASLLPFLERLAQSQVSHYCFDATTDLGIPTVFSVQTSPHDSNCELLVSCATALDVTSACAKTIREAASTRDGLSKTRPIPAAVQDFNRLTHGADYYSRGGHNGDFDFLFKNRSSTNLRAVADGIPNDVSGDGQCLSFLIDRLKQFDMDAIAVDLTTEEVREAGLWVVRVIIPHLMPISFVHRARYLGTQRLYDYAQRFGIMNLTDQDINPNPIPFA